MSLYRVVNASIKLIVFSLLPSRESRGHQILQPIHQISRADKYASSMIIYEIFTLKIQKIIKIRYT